MGAYRDALMRWKRDAFIGLLGSPLRYRFGSPATRRQLSEAAASLGIALPAPLRALYGEFDGVWGDGVVWDGTVLVPTDLYEVLPCGMLGPWRMHLAGHYPYIDGFAAEIVKCVPFDVREGGASFHFLTDELAWGVPTEVVGRWDHDGGGEALGVPLEEFLAR